MGLDVEEGSFGENFTTENLDLNALPIGTKLKIGDDILVEISQLGKVCHTRCAIYYAAGDCIFPREGIFFVALTTGRPARRHGQGERPDRNRRDGRWDLRVHAARSARRGRGRARRRYAVAFELISPRCRLRLSENAPKEKGIAAFPSPLACSMAKSFSLGWFPSMRHEERLPRMVS